MRAWAYHTLPDAAAKFRLNSLPRPSLHCQLLPALQPWFKPVCRSASLIQLTVEFFGFFRGDPQRVKAEISCAHRAQIINKWRQQQQQQKQQQHLQIMQIAQQ